MSTTTRNKLLVVGCGYTGQRVAQRVWSIDPRRDIAAMVRRGSSLQQLTAIHLPALAWDLDRPATAETRATVNERADNGTILYSTPPPREGLHDTRIKRFLASLQVKVQHFIYLSTTGVYGDRRGDWVDEDTPTNPQNDRSKRRLDAENQVISWCDQHDTPWSILRIAGIYGPERLPLRKIKSGDTVVKPNEAPWGNHIHVDDLVRGCCLLIQASGQNQIINVSDGEPRPSGDLRRVVAKIAKLKRPNEIGIDQAHETFSEMRLSFAVESRRVDNKRFAALLGGALLYPNLEVGVAASLPNESKD